MKTKPKLVNWTSNPDDIKCAIMGKLGLSTKAIARETGLTKCQIGYRLHKAKIRRVDFRDGNSETSKLVMNSCANKVKSLFYKELE